MADALTSSEIKKRGKDHSQQQSALKHVLKHANAELMDTNTLATEVAEGYNMLENKRKDQSRKTQSGKAVRPSQEVGCHQTEENHQVPARIQE